MAQHDYIIDNASGAVFRGDVNDALEAIATNNSGTSAPSVTYPYMWWPDVTNGLLKQRNGANTGWITIGSLGSSFSPYVNGSAITAAGSALLDDADVAAQRTTLGLGTAAIVDTGSSGATIPLCNGANTWGGQQTPAAQVLTDAATVSVSIISQIWTLTTAGSRTINAPTGAVTNTSYRLVLTTGGYSPSWNTVFKFPDGAVPSGLSGTCIFDFHYDGTYFHCTSQSIGEA